MKTRIIMAVLFCTLTVVTARAQKSKNLLWDKVPTEFTVGGHALVDGVNGGGIDLAVDKNFPVSDYVALGFGGMVSTEYNKEVGCMTDLLARVNLRLGKSLGGQLSGLLGAGDMSYEDISTNALGSVATYTNVALRPVAGGEVSFFVKVSEIVKISVYGRYLYYFNSRSDRSYEEADGFTHESTEFNLNKVAVGTTVTIAVGGATEKKPKGRQVSGDNQWYGEAFTGSSFGENKGFLVGAGFVHSKRISATLRRELGFGSQQIFADGGNSFNEIYGKLGLMWEPWGATSPILFPFGVKVGGGEYLKGEQAATETGSYAMKSRVQVPGVVGKGYFGVSIPVTRQLHLNACVEAGWHTCFDTEFCGSKNFGGDTFDKTGFDGSWSVGLQWSF